MIFQVKTETTADLNVLHEQKSKTATEEHERRAEGDDNSLKTQKCAKILHTKVKMLSKMMPLIVFIDQLSWSSKQQKPKVE